MTLPREFVEGYSSHIIQIANEEKFRAFLRFLPPLEDNHKQLLIQNRDTQEWHSLVLPGAETNPHVVNEWLVGVVADPNPENDYEARRFYGAVPRTEVILIDPFEVHQFTVNLGKQSEVLWIEGDSVWYRIDDGLYQARIENDNFVDRTLLVKDSLVTRIHWAFRGKRE